MILTPGVLALLVGSGCVVLLLAVCSWHAGVIVKRWDLSSSSAGQLELERRTHLVSTVVAYGLGCQLLSALLFVHTVDDLHPLVVGAMCATGVLNANPVGWYALAVKLVLLFATGFWLALDAVDRRAEDYPLCRVKFGVLLGVAPLVVLDFVLQARFFLGLRPDVITSCCGSLFTPAGQGLASTLSALPARPTLYGFFASAAALVAVAGFTLWRPTPARRYALAALALWFLPASGMAIVSVISPYIYESPIHHCPFDFLQAGYRYLGYPVYLSLAVGVFFGALPAAFERLKRISSLAEPLERLQHRWVLVSLVGLGVFLTLVAVSILSSNLTRLGGP
ncbi:MAG: hypothetical protein HZB55_24550 [Deltaproteobacteria bacterium]|nr:hypothetical protein [Deltaproteobacteria bacterium]